MNEARQIVCDESGFTVIERGKTLTRVSWSEVLEVFAYKGDRLTTDDNCPGFRVHEDDTSWIVSEDFIGYKELLAELAHRFSGIRSDWLVNSKVDLSKR